MAIAAVKGDRTLSEREQQSDDHPSQITAWEGQLVEGTDQVFGGGHAVAGPELPIELKAQNAKIGELRLQSDFSSAALAKAGQPSAKRWSIAATN